VTIVTDAFLPLAAAQARARNRRDLPFVVVSHPVGGLRMNELASRVAEAEIGLTQLQHPV
jgi:hypothetical protein